MKPSRDIAVVCCWYNRGQFESCVAATVPKDVEVLSWDNCGNEYTVPTILWAGVQSVKAPVVVCCHEDIRFPKGWFDLLPARLAGLDAGWAIAGVAGVLRGGAWVSRISDPNGLHIAGAVPQQVYSLDECCVVVRAADSDRLAFDRANGNHFYAVDYCLQARLLGRGAWVIDGFVEHVPKLDRTWPHLGNDRAGYLRSARFMYQKWHGYLNESAVGQTIWATHGRIDLAKGTATSALFGDCPESRIVNVT